MAESKLRQRTESQVSGSRRSRALGFSIVEMAVVIMVLGITMAMTLKGTVLIDIVKAVWAGYEMQLFQSRVQLYAVQYGYLPGDDPKAAARFGHPEAARLQDGVPFVDLGDSKLNGRFTDYDSPNGEQFMAWRDLRYAKLLSGDPALTGAAAMPSNPFNGVYGFDEGNLGQARGSICLNKVPGGAAQRIDDSLDDGRINQGQVVATAAPDDGPTKGHFPTPDAQGYNVEKEYIICISLSP